MYQRASDSYESETLSFASLPPSDSQNSNELRGLDRCAHPHLPEARQPASQSAPRALFHDRQGPLHAPLRSRLSSGLARADAVLLAALPSGARRGGRRIALLRVSRRAPARRRLAALLRSQGIALSVLRQRAARDCAGAGRRFIQRHGTGNRADAHAHAVQPAGVPSTGSTGCLARHARDRRVPPLESLREHRNRPGGRAGRNHSVQWPPRAGAVDVYSDEPRSVQRIFHAFQ